MPHATTDETLMGQVVEGDERALETLIRRHAASLLSYLARMHADRSRAEDAFQEVWLSVWTRRRSFDSGRRFKPWLFRIAKNRAVSATRRRRVGVINSDPDCSAGPSEADGLEQDEALRVAGAAIHRLPPSQREVVCLRLYAALSYVEVATVLEITESTARSQMSLALRALRASLCGWVDAPVGAQEESPDDRSEARG
ncbi:MAG: sigma-70 family RNA polymerase sigma factor [Planctomycetota bacterium]